LYKYVMPPKSDITETLEIIPNIGAFEISVVLSYDVNAGLVCNAGFGKRKELITFFSKIKAKEWPNFKSVSMQVQQFFMFVKEDPNNILNAKQKFNLPKKVKKET
jgi:hypothetical protein